MTQSLETKQTFKDAKSLISLAGRIDEHADFSQVSFENIKAMLFDFDQVRMINSMGIQAWISFLKRVPKRIAVGFRRCPLRIINQMNLFPDFTAGRPVAVLSFYAPYYCEACDQAASHLLTTKTDFPQGADLLVPSKSCAECGETMEFGAIEEKYLLFLKRSREA